MTRPISLRQEEFLRADDKRINLLSGSVRSGKTWISLLKWALFVGSCPANYEFLMCGKTLTTLKRNCLNELQTLVGSNNFTYSTAQKSAWLFGRRIWLEGANDDRSEAKIRGMTLGGAYIDELTLIPEDFYVMLLSRLSRDGARFYATTNPDSPEHWVYKKLIEDNGTADLTAHWQFDIRDNIYLSPEYVADLERLYTGVFYDRYIRGEWVVADGLIYQFDPVLNTTNAEPKTGTWYISIDYGTQNPCSMGLWRVDNNRAVRVDEYYYSGRDEQHQMTDDEYYAELVKLVGDRSIEAVIVDPSAASFITLIKRRGQFRVRPAKNDVLDGIRVTASLLHSGKIVIHERCKNSIREFGLYSWDKKAKEDKPLKENDHAMDDIRYFCYTVLRRQFLREVDT